MKTILVVLCTALLFLKSQAQITMTPFIAEGPNLNSSRASPDRATYVNNLFEAIIYGINQVGPIGQPGSFTLAGTTEAPIRTYYIIDTDYHSWGPDVNPPNPPFRDQFGGVMVEGGHVFGNGVDKFLPDSITYDENSNDKYGLFTGKYTGKVNSFAPFMWGAIYNSDGTKTWIKSGSLVPVNELIFYQTEAIFAVGSGSSEQIHQETMENWKDPFNINITISFRGSQDVPGGGSSPFEIFADTTHITIAVPASGAPLLSISRTSTNTVAVFWPSPSTGFVLQQNTNGIATVNWSNIITAPSDDGTTKTVIVNPPTGNRFYRLFKP